MDNEFDLNPVAPGLQPVHRKNDQHIELDPAEQLVLANWATSQEYQVFLKLAEGEIQKAETEHFQVWKQAEPFQRTGLMAVGMRIFFERIQKEVKHQREEFSGQLEFLRNQEEELNESPEQFIHRSVQES